MHALMVRIRIYTDLLYLCDHDDYLCPQLIRRFTAPVYIFHNIISHQGDKHTRTCRFRLTRGHGRRLMVWR